MPSIDGVLKILDASAEDFIFPMLDNGYIFPAAARLSVFRGDDGWAVVVENFGFSPRAGIPDTFITSIGEGLIETEKASDFASQEAFETFCRANEFSRQDIEWPLKEGDWIEEEFGETLREECLAIPLRGEDVAVPSLDVLTKIDGEGGIGEPLHLANVCRALAASHRSSVLANGEFTRIPRSWTRLLHLDEWRHPDLAEDELPSAVATFQSLARVIASADASLYQPQEPNTHWSHWPEGGTL